MEKFDLIVMAKTSATRWSLDPPLVCAIVEQESGWNPWSYRYEPLFFHRYIEPKLGEWKIDDTEAIARACSWGLMQTMGQVAREFGYFGPCSQMLDPLTGLNIGCQVFSHKLRQANGDVTAALLAWNGGARPEYASEVLARVGGYK